MLNVGDKIALLKERKKRTKSGIVNVIVEILNG